MADLEGRVALVTGGARRLGAALTRALHQWGASVAVHYGSSEEAASQLAAELNSERADSAATFGADLRDGAEAADLPGRVIESFGRIDVLVNSAAGMERLEMGRITPNDWNDVLSLNLTAPFLLSQAATGSLKETQGCIVNMADVSAYEPWRNFLPHSVSKSGVVALTRALAKELAPEIRVNAIAPGPVLPPDDWDRDLEERMRSTTPLKRLGDPVHIVRTLEFILDCDFITGETILVDGGRRVRVETEY